MNNVNPFPTLTAPCTFVFLLHLSNTKEISLVANLSETSLAKETARSNNTFFYLNYPSYYLTFHQEILLIGLF